MPNPIPSTDVQDFLENVKDFDSLCNLTAGAYVDRLGNTRLSVAEFFKKNGYEVPVAFASGIAVSRVTQTVTYSGNTYHALATAIPFTTTGTFNAAQWEMMSGLTRQELGGEYGSGLVGSATYTQLRAYAGDATRIQLSDGGIAIRRGTAADNGGTVWKDGLNRSWERVIDGYVNALWFGADPKYFPAADNITPIQNAVNALAVAGGGVVYVPSGIYLGPDGLVIPDNVSLIGESRDSAIIRKTSANTKTVTIYAGPLVVYNANPLPSAINAVVVLTGSGGRYNGKISDITLEGTYATPGDYESQLVEFGVVSVGSLSDFAMERCYVNAAQYGVIIPTVFAGIIQNNRISECLQAVGIDDGTSLTYTSNYANNCRDGHFLRGLKYSPIMGNAADYTNDPAKYPTRNTVHFAYRLRSLVCCDVMANGNEQTWGRSYWLESLDGGEVSGNTTIGVGSDYTGSSEIAVIYSDGILRNCDVLNNVAYGVKSGGLIYGGANSAKHHNFYFETTAFVSGSKFEGNIVRASLSGLPVEAGWGNNNPSNWINATDGTDIVRTFSPTITANTVGDLSVTYGSANKHYRHDVGNMYHIFGCFDVTVSYTTASSYLLFQGFPANQTIDWRIAIVGVDGGGALSKKLSSFRIGSGIGSGIAFDNTENPFNITDIPTGTNVKIFYDGWYAKV